MRNKINRILTWKGDIDKEEICKKFLLLVAMGVIIFYLWFRSLDP